MLSGPSRINCLWCQGEVKFGPGPQIRLEWVRYQCCVCKTISYKDMPNKKSLDDIYQTAWQGPEVSGKFAAGSTNEFISKALLKAVGFEGDGLCLDYGAGKGGLSQAIVDLGGHPIAIEPYGKKLSGVDGITWFETIDELDQNIKFDWIFLVEVIEHMIKPVEELSRIIKLLTAKGKLIITTPNALGWRARKDKFLWREAQNPTHLTLFTEMSLRICLKKAGLKKIKRIYKPVDYGRGSLFVRVPMMVTQLTGIDGGLRFVSCQ